MESTSQTLTIEEIIELNRQQIDLYGGSYYSNGNFLNRDSLVYTLDALDAVSFGYVLYPTIESKAACLAFNIITKHVFQDGNKRTAMSACRIFLLLNGYDLEILENEIDEDVINISIDIATHKIELEEFIDWIKLRMKPIS